LRDRCGTLGKEKAIKAPYYILTRSETGNFVFTLNSIEGLVLLTSPRFTEKARALSRINAVRSAARKLENFETFTSNAGQFSFILRNTKKTEILGTGEMYLAEENVSAAMSLIRAHARTAKLDDQTDIE
jgi:uncharacterized protein YegP (UPF0339 family)